MYFPISFQYLKSSVLPTAPRPQLQHHHATRKHNRCCFLADLRRPRISSLTLPPASISLKLLTAKTKGVRDVRLHIRDENSLNIQYCLHPRTKGEGGRSKFLFVLFALYRRLAHERLPTFSALRRPNL